MDSNNNKPSFFEKIQQVLTQTLTQGKIFKNFSLFMLIPTVYQLIKFALLGTAITTFSGRSYSNIMHNVGISLVKNSLYVFPISIMFLLTKRIIWLNYYHSKIKKNN